MYEKLNRKDPSLSIQSKTLSQFYEQHHHDILELMDQLERKLNQGPYQNLEKPKKVKIPFEETKSVVYNFMKSYLSEEDYKLFESLHSDDKILFQKRRKSYIDNNGKIHLGLHYDFLDILNYVFQFGNFLVDHHNEASFLFGNTIGSFFEDLLIMSLQKQGLYEQEIERVKEIKYYCFKQLVHSYLYYEDKNMRLSQMTLFPEVLAIFLKTKLSLDYQNHSLETSVNFELFKEQIGQNNIEGALRALKMNPALPSYDLQDFIREYVSYYQEEEKVLKRGRGV